MRRPAERANLGSAARDTTPPCQLPFRVIVDERASRGSGLLWYEVETVGIAYDLRQNKFDEELFGKIGLDPKIMPDFFSCEEIIRSITEAAAKETNLVAGIPVAGRLG